MTSPFHKHKPQSPVTLKKKSRVLQCLDLGKFSMFIFNKWPDGFPNKLQTKHILVSARGKILFLNTVNKIMIYLSGMENIFTKIYNLHLSLE